MDYVTINGVSYDVLVTNIKRVAAIKNSENSGSTLGAGSPETLDPLGTFITYSVTFKRRAGYEKKFDDLWDCIIKPYYNGIPVKFVYNQKTIEYDAKFEVAEQNLDRIDKSTGKIYWGEITVDCVPTKAQVLPV